MLTEKGSLIGSKKSRLMAHQLVAPADHRTIPLSAKTISRSILSGEKNNLIQLLKNFDENIEGIEILSPTGERSYTYFKHKILGFAPISVFGDGVRRVLTVANALIQAKNGILLIDEIETAIHAQLFNKFFNWLVQSCRDFNVQLIATTHSIEALDSILSADKENLEHFSTYRLQKNIENGSTESRKFSGEDLYAYKNKWNSSEDKKALIGSMSNILTVLP